MDSPPASGDRSVVTAKTALDPKGKRTRPMLKLGLLLAAFDFVFETCGLLVGYWRSSGNVLFIGPAVPLDMVFIAFLARATAHMVFPKRFSWSIAVPTSITIAAVGTAVEAVLISIGNIVYYAPWTSFHAFVWYFIVFLALQKVNELVSMRRAERKTPAKG